MEFTSIKQTRFNTAKNTLTLISFTVFLTILSLGSCAEEITAPPNNPPPIDYMSFTLTNGSMEISTISAMNYGSTYLLTITPTSGASINTADYTITFNPASVVTVNTTRTNSVDFTIGSSGTTLAVTATHKANSAISETLTLTLVNPNTPTTDFARDIQTTVPNLATANALTRAVLEPLSVATGTPLEKRYVTETGGGSYNGSSWVNAWAATNLRNAITNITDATASKVYLVMVAGGTYKPTYSTTTITTTDRAISFRMTNHVAIMGGFDPAGGWGRTGTTIFSGDIGAAGNADNSYTIFSHINIPLGNAHLYGVTITGGNANGAAPLNSGGGMYNDGSSPVLTEVVFSGNTVTGDGGGMFNRGSSSPVLTGVVFSRNTASEGGGVFNRRSSSPVLTGVVFSGNTASEGGGMYNIDSSSPILSNVVFSENTATVSGGGMANSSSSPVLAIVVFSRNTASEGGGMYNSRSSPVLTRIMFSGNTVTGERGRGGGGMYNSSSSPILTSAVFFNNSATGALAGGGMYNLTSSPVIIGAVFTGNSASNGGGMWNDNDGGAGPLIVNTIFSDNTTNAATGNGPDIAMRRENSGGAETIRIAGSILGVGLPAPNQPTNAIVGYGGTAAININYRSLANGAVSFGTDDPLTFSGMDFPYPIIVTGFSAINLGLYVRRDGTTYYFSEDNATWYTGFSATGGWGSAATPPTTAIDLTTTDIAGTPRNGRPDAGVTELP